MIFADLFCGIGGFRLALESFGHECVFSCDIDTAAKQSYAANFGEMPEGDITQIPSERIPPHDILCAGFPCQPFSISGRQDWRNDRRNLFLEIIRIALKRKPRLILLENVPNILSIGNGQAARWIYESLESIGYTVTHTIINASDVGLPQNRKRVFFTALETAILTPPQSRRQDKFRPLSSFMRQEFDDICLIDYRYVLYRKPLPHPSRKLWRIGVRLKSNGKLPAKKRGGGGMTVYDASGLAQCQVCSNGDAPTSGGLYFVGRKRLRTLHIEEQKAIMGFPESHILSGSLSKQRKLLGNAVVPECVREICRTLDC